MCTERLREAANSSISLHWKSCGCLPPAANRRCSLDSRRLCRVFLECCTKLLVGINQLAVIPLILCTKKRTGVQGLRPLMGVWVWNPIFFSGLSSMLWADCWDLRDEIPSVTYLPKLLARFPQLRSGAYPRLPKLGSGLCVPGVLFSLWEVGAKRNLWQSQGRIGRIWRSASESTIYRPNW